MQIACDEVDSVNNVEQNGIGIYVILCMCGDWDDVY